MFSMLRKRLVKFLLIEGEWLATLRATCKAAENDCLTLTPREGLKRGEAKPGEHVVRFPLRFAEPGEQPGADLQESW